MSNKAKPVQKEKKSKKVVDFIRKYGLTLIKNEACFDMRKSHWYSAVPVALVCLILSVIPLSVSTWNVQGSQILGSPKNGIDNGLVGFQTALSENNIDININGETHTATLPKESKDIWKNGTEEKGFYKLGRYTVFADTYTREKYVTETVTKPKDADKTKTEGTTGGKTEGTPSTGTTTSGTTEAKTEGATSETTVTPVETTTTPAETTTTPAESSAETSSETTGAEKQSKIILAKAQEPAKTESTEPKEYKVVKKTEKEFNLVVFDLSDLAFKEFHDAIWGSGKDGRTKDGLLSILASKDIKGNEVYSTPSLFIGKDRFALARFPQGLQTNSYREFEYTCPSFNLKDLAKQDIEGKKYTVSYTDLKADTIDAYYNASMAAWSQLFDYGYNNQRIVQGWINAGVWFGINTAVTFVIGLLFFLVSRGKKCINRDLTFWETQKIAYWTTITPAILALCFGFTKPIYAQYAFLFFMLIRGIWMMTNTINPRVIEEK